MNATTTAGSPPSTLAGRLRGFASGARELDDAPVVVRGALPPWLEGSLLFNGPATWDLHGGGYEHWFDGLAMLHRLRIGPDGVRYRSRALRSADQQASVAAGRPAMGAFGTPNPESLWQRLRHFGTPSATDNGAVTMGRVDGQWVAQTENPLITCFDPDTLETLGRLSYDDDEPMQLMSAHSHTDASGVYWNVGVEVGPRCTYKLYRIRPGSRRREVVARLSVPKSGYLHAFAMTPDHALWWEPAMRAQPLGFLLTGRSYIDNFRWDPASGSKIHAVSLADGAVRTWTVPPMLAFHAAQAWQEADGSLGLDLVTTPDAAIFEAFRLRNLRAGKALAVPHTLSRYLLRGEGGTIQPEAVASGFELPQVHPGCWGQRRARWSWGAGQDPEARAPFFDRTLKLDLDTGAVMTWARGGAVQLEPLFVARPGAPDEDDGVLLVPTLADADEGTVIAVVDAASMREVASLVAPQVLPFGFHAAWSGGPG